MNLLSCPLFLQTQILILNKGKELNPNLKEGKRKRKSRERDRNVGKMRISEEGLGVRSKVMVLVYLEFPSVFYHFTSFFCTMSISTYTSITVLCQWSTMSSLAHLQSNTLDSFFQYFEVFLLDLIK